MVFTIGISPGWKIDFLNGIELEADLDNVPALAPRRLEMWDRINTASFLSPEEKRKILKV